ncbi:MAG: hypothetical protein PUE79_07000, partial [Bacteroidales bacterium]|nr:hypothetical protein [Bacteroidales bacterium]
AFCYCQNAVLFSQNGVSSEQIGVSFLRSRIANRQRCEKAAKIEEKPLSTEAIQNEICYLCGL